MSQANQNRVLVCLSCVCQLFVNEHIIEINHTKKEELFILAPSFGCFSP